MDGSMMGAPAMESDGTPTVGEKTPEPKKPPPGRPPFQLCFKLAKVRGRSDISPCHPRGFGKMNCILYFNIFYVFMVVCDLR